MAAPVKLCRATWHVLRGWWTIKRHFSRLTNEERAEHVQQWAIGMLDVLNVNLKVEGVSVSKGPVLRVCNHISWLDILVIHAAGHCRFVSKAQVRRWPIIGVLAQGGGTLFIERESRKDALRVVHHMADRLCESEVLTVFPEGTTTDGKAMLPFHANLIQAAISADAPVQAMGLCYTDGRTGQPCLTPAYIGDDSLVGSLWKVVCGPSFDAVLRFGTPQSSEGRTRRQWSADLQGAVQSLRR